MTRNRKLKKKNFISDRIKIAIPAVYPNMIENDTVVSKIS